MADPYGWLEKSLATIRRAQWHRAVKPLAGKAGPMIALEGRSLLNFASNDYLGLAGDERLIAAAIAAVRTYGTGSTGSRLTSGQREIHQALETAIAALKQTEAALVFSSGYLANLGAIAALMGPRDLIVGDQYNHSSLKAGATLSGATVIDFAHNDLADLAAQLEQHRPHHRRCLITADSVFSMDGDLCPLPGILSLGRDYDAMVLVDEAHGTGVMGATGAGVVEHFGCTGQPLIQVGTLSKALGSLGGYVAGSALVIDFLRNRAPSWIYTTGLSPGDTAAALAAVQVVKTEPERRSHLWRNVAQLRDILGATFDLLPSESPILCAKMASPAAALQMSAQLSDRGIFVPAIRPPTVPTSRLRFSVMATHTPAQLEQVRQALPG
ncbi:8-amino-7-oxononanoate synthase [Spirulina major CS-329]|uniref:8-amino-7-oxononanoate synthase n=1 Tax=Spirulina TaxID=1154 RepID=UPI00232EBA5E|nr:MULTISPECIES: 8-amino-7-oxononanoate synthase [Spirulina]MDB9496965.1 8-amino-7-oxononanoate synthase [Spirulina subsalsa CS-330]MDB9502356.1 8-amino-7-oxononanoate synthase [Spirulina major CS-329]